VLSSCAAMRNLAGPDYGELTIHYPDGDVITYLLPPEFPKMNENQVEYVPVSVGFIRYAVCIRQVIGENKYGIFVTMDQNAEILGAASIIGERDSWWIYRDGKPSETTCSYEQFEAHAIEFLTELLTPKTET